MRSRASLLTEAAVYVAVLSAIGLSWITRARTSVEVGHQVIEGWTLHERETAKAEDEVRKHAWRVRAGD